MNLSYLKAFSKVMEIEGGGQVHDVRGDPGGRTVWGISEANWPDMWSAGTPDLLDAIEFYHREFWLPLQLGDMPYHLLRFEVFEFAVNAGPSRSIRALQKSLNDIRVHVDQEQPRVTVDGSLGPQTMAEVRRLPYSHLGALIRYFNRYQLEHYESLSPNMKKLFLRGLMTRV